MSNRSHAKATTANSHINALDFAIRNLISGLYTATVVQVQAVYGRDGAGEPDAFIELDKPDEIASPYFVDVLPLVKQLDNQGKGIEQSVIYKVPYSRIQGGESALVIDPKVGDLGICVFAMRDISAVKNLKEPSLPATRRSYDPADGMYIGGLLNGQPKRYVKISDDGGVVISGVESVSIFGDNTSITAQKINITASESVNVATKDAYIKAEASVNVNAFTATVQAETNIIGNTIVAGNLTVNGGNLLVNGGIAWTGLAVPGGTGTALAFKGDVKVDGVVTTTDTLADTVSLKTHTHGFIDTTKTITPPVGA